MMQLSENSNELKWCIHFMMRYAQYECHIDNYISLETLIPALEKQGFMFEKFDILQKKFQSHALPGLMITKAGGYGLLLKYNRDHFWVEHPQYGKASYSITSFEKYFESTIYIFKRRQEYDFKKGLIHQLLKTSLMRWFQNPWLGGFILFSIILYEGLSLIEPLFLNMLIQHVGVVSSFKDLALGGTLLGLILIVGLAIGFYRHRLWVYFFGQCAMHVTQQMFRQYLDKSLVILYIQDTHDVYTRFYAIEQMLYRVLQQFFYVFLEFIFILLHGIVMFYCQSTLAIVDAIFLIIMGGIHYFGMQHSFEQAKNVQIKQQSALAILMENMKSIVQIKLFQAEAIFFKRWGIEVKNYWRCFLKNENTQLQIEWWMTFVKKSNWLICLIMALYFLNRHQLTLGIFIAYLSIKTLVYSKSESLFKRLLQWQYIKAPLYRIQQIFLEFEDKDKQKLEHHSQDIFIRNLEIHGQSLKNLKLVHGKKYILTGMSGCGKTTLLKMLMGVIPCGGEIYYPQKYQIYKDMVFVQQEELLWETSLLNNITVFDEIHNHKKLNQILDIVGMLDWQSRLHEESIHLSGGEKQRILIARALYREPKWLILDESTCHLDEISERKLIKSLTMLPISIVMVNHRQETHKYFDEVIEWKDLVRSF